MQIKNSFPNQPGCLRITTLIAVHTCDRLLGRKTMSQVEWTAPDIFCNFFHICIKNVQNTFWKLNWFFFVSSSELWWKTITKQQYFDKKSMVIQRNIAKSVHSWFDFVYVFIDPVSKHLSSILRKPEAEKMSAVVVAGWSRFVDLEVRLPGARGWQVSGWTIG